jgi:hypothetical protein
VRNILLLLLCCGCAGPEEKVNKMLPLLPKTATNVKMLGNGWATFELDEKKFLYQFRYDNFGSNTGNMILIQIKD